jgi:crotonobetainyl-CoA:carnitine CoA-transferase CaiB-like acyl-CoA transferase
MAASVIAALEHRRDSGRGCHIDSSMYELCVQQMRSAFAGGGTDAARRGNADAAVFHQGVYAARGEDRWIAITFHTESDWRVIAAREGLRGDDVAARDVALTAWCAPRHDTEAVDALQSSGIAAGVVQDMSDLFERDPVIRERHSLMPLAHPVLGTFGHMRTPIDFSHSRPRAFRAPLLGEHNRQIATVLCGFTAARIDELETLGVFK